MATSGDLHTPTNQHRAIELKHFSPSWVEEIDQRYGKAKEENGGYFTLNAQFEAGAPKPRWYDIILRFLPWRKDT